MLKARFLKRMNLIKTTLEFKLESLIESMIIRKIIFNLFDFINKEYKLVNYKKNI